MALTENKAADKNKKTERDGNNQPQGFKKIVIGHLAVDPLFLLIFLFFTTCSLLMLLIIVLNR